MKVRMDEGCPHRFWVTSESDKGVEYCVELGAYPIGLNAQGVMVYNGACIATLDPDGRIDARGHHGCRNFLFDKEPKLRKPENIGKVFRCKHCVAAREFALDFLVPHLIRADPNISEDNQI